MKLRKLELKDAEYMLEWMHDISVVKDLQANFMSKTVEDCKHFILAAQDMSKDMHLAMVNDKDEYMGTVSLKHITSESAEFAIIIRKSAMGLGYSREGMTEIIRMGLNELNLKKIYWCVNPANERAIRFYNKSGYEKVESNKINFFEDIKQSGGYTFDQIDNYFWYVVSKE